MENMVMSANGFRISKDSSTSVYVDDKLKVILLMYNNQTLINVHSATKMSFVLHVFHMETSPVVAKEVASEGTTTNSRL